MDYNDFLRLKPIIVDIRAESKSDAIEELVDRLVVHEKIKPENRDTLLAAVKERELSMSTAIGFGIGLPHASTDLISDVLIAIGKSRNGIPYGSPDGKPVNFVALLIMPNGQFQKYLEVMAQLAKLLQREDFRKGL